MKNIFKPDNFIFCSSSYTFWQIPILLSGEEDRIPYEAVNSNKISLQLIGHDSNALQDWYNLAELTIFSRYDVHKLHTYETQPNF